MRGDDRRGTIASAAEHAEEQPRVRGDDASPAPPMLARPTEQPRVRGDDKRQRCLFDADRGNSPACAGTTLLDLRVYRAEERFSIGLVGAFWSAAEATAPAGIAPTLLLHVRSTATLSLFPGRGPQHQVNSFMVDRHP